MLDRREWLWTTTGGMLLSGHGLVGTVLANPQGQDSVTPDPTKVFDDKLRPSDPRRGPLKTLNDYFPFAVPTDLPSWERRRQRLREQLLVALGLWPMPEAPPLRPVVHGMIDRGDYTIEKVYFASLPGHYVCGNLYRPRATRPDPSSAANPGTAAAAGRKFPAVLFAHGHWANGRFHDAGEKAARAAVEAKGEPDLARGRFFMQALPATLARLGFIVFHYDMVGYADSTAIPHRDGFRDAAAELRLQNVMGLQTWNSRRALDFLLSLPEVDPHRIGMTGASGGGTQTFILAAIDDRLACVFPAVMVSTAMQGGCVCENASHLRVGTGNVEIAALFAPKPMAFSAANDWTKEFLTKGFPELQRLYALYKAPDKVAARAWLEYGHQYNVHARQFMYRWFLQHLQGRDEEVVEPAFEPVEPKQLSVFDAALPRPNDEKDAAALRTYLTEQSQRQLEQYLPRDAASLKQFRHVFGTAWRVMLHTELPAAAEVRQELPAVTHAGAVFRRLVIGRSGEKDAVPCVLVHAATSSGTPDACVVWLHPQGKSSLLHERRPTEVVQRLLAAGVAVLAPDLLGTGENARLQPYVVNKEYAGYTYGYNRTLAAEQVHDALTAIAFAQNRLRARTVDLVGWDGSGWVAVLARVLAGDAVRRTVADAGRFRYAQITDPTDLRLIPGALKYGDVDALTALCAPGELLLYNAEGCGINRWAAAAYRAAGAPDRLTLHAAAVETSKVIAWLVR